jgi:hypothetical protein
MRMWNPWKSSTEHSPKGTDLAPLSFDTETVHYLKDYLIWRQAYRLQLRTLQTPSLPERNDSLLQQAMLQRRLNVMLSDKGPRNNTELKHIFQHRSFVPHYVTIVTDILIWFP